VQGASEIKAVALEDVKLAHLEDTLVGDCESDCKDACTSCLNLATAEYQRYVCYKIFQDCKNSCESSIEG
jgi:hypothetical protein